MNFTVNSATLNGSSGSNLVVASILSGLLVLAGTADANLRVNAAAVNGNVGTVTTALANQRVVSSSAGSVVVTGSATGIRYRIHSSNANYLYTTGSASANYIADGSNSTQLGTSGSILPNFKVDVEVLSGSSDVSGDINPLRLKVVRCNPGVVSLQVDLITPNVVPVIDLYVTTSLNGYLIPANHLGYGEAGSLNTEMSCEAVRVVLIQAHGRLWEDGPQLITNDAATLKHFGYLPTTGVTNVAIKIEPQNHFTWYYEDWLTLNIGSMEVVPRLFTGIVDAVGRITVTVTAEATIRKAPKLNNTVSSISGPSMVYIVSAGALAASLEFKLIGNSVAGVVLKKAYATTNILSTSGAVEVVKYVPFSGTNLFLNTQGSIVAYRGRSFAAEFTSSLQGAFYFNVIKNVELLSTSTVMGVSATPLVYKKVKTVGEVPISGSINSLVGTTLRSYLVATTGYCYSNMVAVGVTAAGTITAFNGPLDGRVVITTNTEEGIIALDGDVVTRVVSPVKVNVYLGLTGNTFAITNLYVKAEESRSASIPSSPYAQNSSLHYIVIPE